ncbi:hypothetical protein M3Y94_00941200 [Aphelenchoides besseyi]|nr:hypothetical protein M3Y94_00941200 [Aphelenchoides besseyi]
MLTGFWWSLALFAIFGSMVLVTNSNTGTCGLQTPNNKTVVTGDCKDPVTVATNKQELVMDIVSTAAGTDNIDAKFDLMLGKCKVVLAFTKGQGGSTLYVGDKSMDFPVDVQINVQDITFKSSTGVTTTVSCDTQTIFTAGAGDEQEVAVQIKPQNPDSKGLAKLKFTIDAPLAQKQEEPSKWNAGTIVGIVAGVIAFLCLVSSYVGSSVFGYKHRRANNVAARRDRLPQVVVQPSPTNQPSATKQGAATRAVPGQYQTTAAAFRAQQAPTVAPKKEHSANSIMAQIKAGYIKDPEVSMQEQAVKAEENAQKSFREKTKSVRALFALRRRNSTPGPRYEAEVTAKSVPSDDEQPRKTSQEQAKSADKPNEELPAEHTAEDDQEAPVEKPVEKQVEGKEVSKKLERKKELEDKQGFFEQKES